MNYELSYFHSPICNIRPNGQLTLAITHRLITSDKWAQTTRYLRSLAPNQQKHIKCKKLNFVTFSGIFSQRKSQNLIRHSNLLCLDFDHVGNEQEIATLRQQFIADSALDVQLLFRSPSGDGLKVVVGADISHEGMSMCEVLARHGSEYRRLSEQIRQTYGLQADATSDVARACFLCHDPEAYINSQLLPVGRNLGLIMHNSQSNRNDYQRIEQMVQRLEQRRCDVTVAYSDWYRIGAALANEFGESGRSLYHRISCFYPRYTYAETNHQYDLCLRYKSHKLGCGTLIYLLKS